MSSVANLSREELLKREKELKDLLRVSKTAKKPDAPKKNKIQSTSRNVETTSNRQQNVPSALRNRVFVRKPLVSAPIKSNLPTPLSESPPSSELNLGSPYSSTCSLESLDRWEPKDKWNRSLILTLGDSSDEDTEDIKNHHAALQQILHPSKSKVEANLKSSVVFKSATKLVKDLRSLKSPIKKVLIEQQQKSSPVLFPKLAIKKDGLNDKTANKHLKLLATLSATTAPAIVPLSANKLKTSASKFKSIRSGGQDAKNVQPQYSIKSKKVFKRTRFKLSKKSHLSPARHKLKLRIPMNSSSELAQSLLMLRGVPFRSSKGGKVLSRINTTLKQKNSTATLAPTTSSKRGHLKTQQSRALSKLARLQNAKTSKQTVVAKLASQLVHRSVYKLNKKQHSAPVVSKAKPQRDCIFFIRFGKCHKADTCKFDHDPKKVSICTKFLRGTCKQPNCPFIHKVDKDRMPLCSYFMQGQCSVQNCPYRHSYFRKDIPHCPDFLQGFCEKGQLCTKQHVLVCSKADCNRNPKICPLFHKGNNNKQTPSAAAMRKKSKRTVVVPRTTVEQLAQAWPEFVVLSGSDEEEVEVQVDMPARTTSKLQKFLDRRTKPVWLDHSVGVSAEPVDLKEYSKIGSKVRQIMKTARWLRRVRPLEVPGDEIPLVFDSLSPNVAGRKRTFSDDSDSDTQSDESGLFYFPMKYPRGWLNTSFRTYGEALNHTRPTDSGAESIVSYTSPESSSDDDFFGFVGDKSKDEVWLLDYMSAGGGGNFVTPGLEFYGPIHDRSDFKIGKKIRRLLKKFRRKHRRKIPRNTTVRTTDYIPLDDTEEGEIVSQSEDDEQFEKENMDDLKVVDMELATDDEQPVEPRSPTVLKVVDDSVVVIPDKKKQKYPQLKRIRKKRKNNSRRQRSRKSKLSALPDFEVISDLEEGEVF